MPSGTRRQLSPARAAVSVVCAVLLHGALGLVFQIVPPWQPVARSASIVTLPDEADAADASKDAPLQIEALVDQIRRIDEAPAPEKPKEDNQRPEGQVVDIARPLIEQRPDDAKYAAEYDSMVKHETRGPSGRGQGGARESLPAAPVTPPAPTVPQARPGTPGRPLPPGALAVAPPLPPGQQRDPVQPNQVGPDGTIGPPGGRPGAPPGARELAPPTLRPGGGGVPGSAPSLAATQQNIQNALGLGVPGTLDYLKDVDEGDSTSLNAKKTRFAVYFNRVKREVAGQWHPDQVYQRHDPSGNIYGVKDRVTVLRVHLDNEGEIVKLDLVKSSGVDFLDDEAQEAFKRCQQFPNPPNGLIDADGQIHFNFGFIFELSGKTSFKIFRYNNSTPE